MEYAVGKPGRIIAAKLSEGDDLYDCIESIAKNENIKAAAVLITGGIRKASVIVGPKQEKPKIKGDLRTFTGPGETLGVFLTEEGDRCRGDAHRPGSPGSGPGPGRDAGIRRRAETGPRAHHQ